jgi:integrase
MERSMRTPLVAAGQPTLAQVLDKISGDADLPLHRRRNLCCSLRAVGKITGKDLSLLPAVAGSLRSIFKDLHPQHCGLSLRRIGNIKSDVLFALRHAGFVGKSRQYRLPLSAEWQRLWDEAAGAGHLRRYVSRFVHYCSANGIRPGEVNDRTLAEFKQALLDDSLMKDPTTTHQGIIRIWNKLVDAVPTWPQTRLTVPRYRESYSIPLDRFPRTFRVEVDAFFDRLQGANILDDQGPSRPLKPKTIKSRRYRLRQIVSALVLSGWKMEQIKSLAQIVELDAAKTALRFYLNRSGGKKTSQIHGLAVLIKVIAKHGVKVDQMHLDALADFCRKMDPSITGMTDKNRGRLRQFDDPKNVKLLLDFPIRVFEKIKRTDQGRRQDAVMMQIALAVELLLMSPMRAENLVALNIQRHLQRSRAGKAGVVHLVIPGDEVKNGEPLEFTLPLAAVKLLDLYLRDYHPRLAGPGSPWLFPGMNGRPKTRELFGDQVSKHVYKATGLRVNLHLFRHIAAKLYLDRNPGGYEVCRRILGHRSMETTTRFYAGMETAAASRHFDEEILKLRHSLHDGRQSSA